MAKILIVDDDRGLLEIISQYLKAYFFEIDLAESAPQARSYLKHSKYDAIVSDFRMPGETGLDLLHYVSSYYPGLPFILMTGSGSSRLRYEAEKMGGSGYIEKPFPLRDLVETLRTVLALPHHEFEKLASTAWSSSRTKLVPFLATRVARHLGNP